MKDLHKVIKTIRLSEKATLLGERNNEYVFSVDVEATKIDIKQAVEKLLGKKVTGVRTANYFGKARQERRATRGGIGRTNHWKKAIVRLKEGEKLDLA
ncbi:MAG TPA: 50S ribosomal protein L23 [Verrucomicrobiales bacterium]|nr:50S ribosomal protein L23 [Verrucomicrobiales bacterium]